MDILQPYPCRSGSSGAPDESCPYAKLAENADLQRQLAEGLYALSLSRTCPEVFQSLLGRAAAVLPGLHWFVSPASGREGEDPSAIVACSLTLQERLGPLLDGFGQAFRDTGFAHDVMAHQRICVEAGDAARAWVPPAPVPALGVLLGIPLVSEGEVLGALFGVSFRDQPGVEPHEVELSVLQSLAQVAALALERLQAEARLEEAARLSHDLAQAVRDLAVATDEDLLIAQLFRWAALLAPLPEWWFNRYDPATRSSLTTHWTPGVEAFGSPEEIRRPYPVRGSASLERLHFHQTAIHLPRWEDVPDLPRDDRWPFRTMVGLPLAHEGTLVGSLSGGSLGEQGHIRVSDAQFDALKSLAEAGGLVMNRLQARRSLEAQERQLFQAQKMESLGVLAGGIAHDFNNLLMGVLGHAGLALEQLSPLHPAKRNLEAIQKAGQRAADLTRQMLAYSGRGQFVVRNLDLTVQVEEMLHLLEVSLPKTVVLHLDLRKGLPTVSADASQIQQVIMNLVINAAEAIGEASGAITIATGALRVDEAAIQTMLLGQDVAPGTYVCFEVTDTGCGMDPDTISRIFEPFFTTKFTGRGLGLSAIMGIVRGHKGALRVYSEVGHGTTFKMLLPALEAAGEAPPAPTAESAWAASGLVLVVDDDETVRAVARQALERKGFCVLEAQDGREAVDLVRGQGPAISLVLLDMTMPRMGGEEAYREMRRLHPDIRVILSSGYNEVEAMGRFRGKGLKGFIQKPYGPRELLATIQGALEA